MDPQLGKAAFRIASFLIISAGGLLFFLKPGTAEFSITVFTLAIGVVFLALILALLRFVGR